MIKVHSKKEAIELIRNHVFTYWPMDITRPQFCEEAADDEDGVLTMTIAALIGIMWLEGMRFSEPELKKVWVALDDMNNVFSRNYIGVDFDTALMMIDKATYTASVMRGR